MPVTDEEDKHSKSLTAEERSCETKRENLEVGRSRVPFAGTISMGAEARLQFDT